MNYDNTVRILSLIDRAKNMALSSAPSREAQVQAAFDELYSRLDQLLARQPTAPTTTDNGKRLNLSPYGHAMLFRLTSGSRSRR